MSTTVHASPQSEILKKRSWRILAIGTGLCLIPYVGFSMWFLAIPLLLYTAFSGFRVLKSGDRDGGLLVIGASIFVAPVAFFILPFCSAGLVEMMTGKSQTATEASTQQKLTSPHSFTNTPSDSLTALEIKASPSVVEEVFLIHVLENLYSRWPNIDASNPSTGLLALDELKNRTMEFEKHISTENFDQQLDASYQSFIGLADAYKILLSNLEAIKNASSEEALAKTLESFGTGVFKGWALGKALDQSGADADAQKLVAGIQLIASFYDAWQSGKQMEEKKKSAINAAVAGFQSQVKEACVTAKNAADGLATKHSCSRSEMGFASSDVPGSESSRRLASSAVDEKMRLAKDRARTMPGNPFAVAEMVMLESENERAGANAETYLKWVQQLVDASKLFPASHVYDPNRFSVIAIAGHFATVAASKQLGKKGYMGAPVEAGKLAVRLLRAAMKLQPSDPDGEVSLSLGLSLAHAGDLVEAKKILSGIAGAKGRSWECHYSLACINSCLGDAQTSLTNLRYALSNGYSDLRWVKEDPDLWNLRQTSASELERLFALKYHWDITYGMLNDDITLTNDSAYTVTNITLRPEVTNSKGTFKARYELKLDRLTPGQSYKWVNAISVSGGRADTDTKKGTFTSDQGTL